MIKKYKNIEGILLSEQSAKRLGEYQIEYENTTTNELEKIEWYQDSNNVNLEYFLKPGESNDNILNHFKERYQEITITKRTALTGFNKHESRTYVDGQLTFLINTLFDSDDNIICMQHLDLTNEQPDYERTMKSFYISGVEVLHADFGDYDAAGDLLRIVYMPTENEQDWESYDKSTLGALGTELGLNLSYYEDATFDPI